MNSSEFVTKVKHYAVDDTVKSVLESLETPKLLPVASHPTGEIAASFARWCQEVNLNAERRAAWFRRMSEEDKAIFREILQGCAESTAFQFFCFIDGVGGDSEGVFEIVESIEGRRKKVLNPQNTDMLHTLLSDVCESDRRAIREREQGS